MNYCEYRISSEGVTFFVRFKNMKAFVLNEERNWKGEIRKSHRTSIVRQFFCFL